MIAQGAINMQNKVSDLQTKLSHAVKQSLDRRFEERFLNISEAEVQ